jgi:hypothetical protein
MMATTVEERSQAYDIAHVVKGKEVGGASVTHRGPGGFTFRTPALDLADLTWSRLEPTPAADVPLAEIVDLLAELGKAMARDHGGLMSQACRNVAATSDLSGNLVERMFEALPFQFQPEIVLGTVDAELGGADVLDGWREVGLPGGTGRIRAYPPRLVHVLAGNAPIVAAMTVVRGAVTKSVSLLKLPSNDLFSVPAVLKTLADIAPDHPVTRSFSAVYWRGGDEAVESALFRSTFFDKLVAWGGDAAIRGSIRYVAPGFELVSFDPKNSISMLGREIFATDESVAQAAALAAADATFFNQAACASARFQFVEGSIEEVDRFCQALLPELAVERHWCDAQGEPPGEMLREEISGLRYLEPEYRVWGAFDGSGVVVRSSDPVDFYPDQRVVNVVQVDRLEDALRWVNISTQTVGVHPPERRLGLLDGLAGAGVQQVQPLGRIDNFVVGTPHDGMFPLHRFVRWVADKD